MIALLSNLVCLLLTLVVIAITVRRGIQAALAVGHAVLGLFFLFREKHLANPPLDR